MPKWLEQKDGEKGRQTDNNVEASRTNAAVDRSTVLAGKCAFQRRKGCLHRRIQLVKKKRRKERRKKKKKKEKEERESQLTKKKKEEEEEEKDRRRKKEDN